MAQLNKVETSRGTRYVVRWSWYADDKRLERTRSFKREADAKAWKAQKELDQAPTDHDQASGKKTVAYWADSWLIHREGDVKRGRIRPSSLHGNRQVVANTVKPLLGERRVRSLTVDDIERYVERVQIDRGVTPATAKQHYGVLRHVLAWAVRKGAIAINPAVGVRIDWSPAVNREPFEPVALDEAEVRQLADALREHAPKTPWPLLIEFMAYSGLRAGEVAGLNVGDLRLLGTGTTIKRAEVHVSRIRVRGKGNSYDQPNLPKTGKVRRVPILPAWLRTDLAAYLAQHPHRDDPGAPLWPGASTERMTTAKEGRGNKQATASWSSMPDYDKPWDRDPFYRSQFKPALKLAGLAPMRLHDLRHTAGSIMLSRGVPDYRVAQYLGHSVDVLHKIYASILRTDVDSDMERFAEDYRPEPSTVTAPSRWAR